MEDIEAEIKKVEGYLAELAFRMAKIDEEIGVRRNLKR